VKHCHLSILCVSYDITGRKRTGRRGWGRMQSYAKGIRTKTTEEISCGSGVSHISMGLVICCDLSRREFDVLP